MLVPSLCGLILTLMAFCAIRAELTVHKLLPIPNNVAVNVAVVVVWCLYSLVCGFSLVSIYTFLGLANVVYAFKHWICPYCKARIWHSLLPWRVTLLIMLSQLYNLRVTWYVYFHWSHELPLLVRLVEIGPFVMLGLQSFGQTCFIFFITKCHVIKESITWNNEKALTQNLYLQMFLNFAFAWHPTTLLYTLTATERCFIVIALIEIVFRGYSLWKLHVIAKERNRNLEMQKHKVQAVKGDCCITRLFKLCSQTLQLGNSNPQQTATDQVVADSPFSIEQLARISLKQNRGYCMPDKEKLD